MYTGSSRNHYHSFSLRTDHIGDSDERRIPMDGIGTERSQEDTIEVKHSRARNNDFLLTNPRKGSKVELNRSVVAITIKSRPVG